MWRCILEGIQFVIDGDDDVVWVTVNILIRQIGMKLLGVICGGYYLFKSIVLCIVTSKDSRLHEYLS